MDENVKIIYQPSDTKHWKLLFEKKSMLLGSHNLNPGEELIATITSVSKETVKGDSGREDVVPVIHFDKESGVPPMCLNITNSQTIASMYGDSTDWWLGKKIQIFATEVKAFGGGKTTGLRIRARMPDVGEDVGSWEKSLKDCESLADLRVAWEKVPLHLMPRLEKLKDEVKEEVSK